MACVADDKHELRAVESVSKEAKERLQLKKKEVKMHQTDVGDEMKKSKESLRNLETEYKDLIELIHKHRDEQVSRSCLLNIPSFIISLSWATVGAFLLEIQLSREKPSVQLSHSLSFYSD